MIQPYKYNKLTQLPCDNDIEQYTDIDLFQLLDLNNPTDRELEAKLYSLIEKYQTIKNNVGQQMKNFYISIFKHFFETEEDEEYNEVEEEKESLLQNTKNQNNKERTGVGNLKEGFETKRNTGEPTQSNNNDPPTYTKNIDYTRGSLNPILKETIKRVVSIDSSFRNKKTYPISTEFTFNLTETLHDVVSLKLYSVSIPYNWYTINQNFGSNFFYIKGISNGIDNNNFEYKIDIGYGNYTDTNLISTVNNSVKTNFIDKNPDISFGETKVEHSTIDGRCKFTMDIKNIYNETNYYLKFPKITYTNPATAIVDSSKNSIPELFGYTKKSYYPFSVYSNSFTADSSITTNYTNNNQYTVNNTNKYFTVKIYEGKIENTKITSDLSSLDIHTITISLNTINNVPITNNNNYFTGTEIYNELNMQLSHHPELIKTFQSNEHRELISPIIQPVKFNDSSYNITSQIYVFKLSIRPNRKNTSNIENQKMIISFPNDNYNVWVGDNSLFKFPKQTMELQNIIAEENSFTTSYLVDSNPYILLRCIADGFYTNTRPNPNSDYGSYIASSTDQNNCDIYDYKIDISNSTSSGYSLDEYHKVIKNSIDSFKREIIGEVGNNENNKTTIQINIAKEIDSENFKIDTQDSFLNLLGFSGFLDGGETYPSTISNSPIPIIDNNNNKFKIVSKNPNIILNECFFNINNGSYNINDLQTEINNTFRNATHNNIHLSGSNIKIQLTENGRNITSTFVVDIRAKLTNKDYKLYFFDSSSLVVPPNNNPSDSLIYNVYNYKSDDVSYANLRYNYNWYATTNSWKNHLKFNDFSYDLVNDIGENIAVYGSNETPLNNLYLTNENNTFELIPIYDELGGVYNIKDSDNPNINNVISFKLNLSVNQLYSKKIITDEINNLLYSNVLTRGSYINTDTLITTIRLNINKVFTAKDYSLVFYDVNTFTRCNYGSHSSAQVTTADTTLGWKMGFRSSTFYNMTPENVSTNPQYNTTYYGNNISNTYTYDASTNIVKLTGDTSVNVNLYNYFLIVLDDYTQNHLNDGLITTTIADTDIPLPSYASKASRKCVVSANKEGVSDTSSYQNKNSLTNAQLYSANQVLNTKMTKYSKNIFSNGPFVQDIFGMIPIKTAGLSPGQTYSEFGGSLQIQERVYFGPVNISRMTVRIITDKGNVLDLNNVDWAFSLITEQLYNPNKG